MFDSVIPVSARKDINIDSLMKEIKESMEEGEAMYDREQITDMSDNLYVAEIIREKLLFNLRDEVPHGVFVKVERMELEDSKLLIDAEIIIDRDSTKGIVIGKGGLMLKKIGTESRKDLEEYFDEKIFLNLFVKVRKN
ncbi:MAG: GTPase Era [Tenericutes bacterium]|nr:MAG: GTPase Era [Mycoplasmatota bacterium]